MYNDSRLLIHIANMNQQMFVVDFQFVNFILLLDTFIVNPNPLNVGVISDNSVTFLVSVILLNR